MRLVLGDTIPVALQITDGNTGLFPRAILYKPDNTVLATLDLAHVANGFYKNTTITYPAFAYVAAVYIVYTDAGHTVESTTYLRAQDLWSQDQTPQSLEVIMGLLHRNAVLDNNLYDVKGLLTSARLRSFASEAAALAAQQGAPDGADGEIHRFLISVVDQGDGKVGLYRLVQDL